jgi:ankyrin repeat protein
MSEDYNYIMDILAGGTHRQFEELSEILDGFPEGTDDFIFNHWITNAIDCGSKLSIEWMLSKGVNLDFREEDGYTPLLSAIERNAPDKYDVLELLLQHGAPVNEQGINDWTPLHMAAARNDIKALSLMLKYGADLSIKTRIDDYATPLEEARILNCEEAVRYLESVSS